MLFLNAGAARHASFWRKVIFQIIVPVLLSVGCGSEAEVHSYDARVLDALAHLDTEMELSDSGRVYDLKLEGQEISGDDWQAICELTELHRLSLYDATFDPSQLQNLANLGRLEALGVGKTTLTDESLQWLADIPNLRWLWLSGCDQLTEAGINDFRAVRPDVEVYK